MDLKNLTQLELLELSRKVSEELEEFDKRDKIKVFRIEAYESANYFSTSEKLKEYFYYLLEEYDFEDMITQANIKMTVDYMNQADFNIWVKE